MKIQATPTYKYIPLIPAIFIIFIALITIPFFGTEGLWIAAAVSLCFAIPYIHSQINKQKLRFDYRSLDWFLFGDIQMIERLLNIAESENRLAVITYSKSFSLKGFSSHLSAIAVRNLCQRRLIEVEIQAKPEHRFDISLSMAKGNMLLKAKDEADLKYRLEKLHRRGWEKSEDQAKAKSKFEMVMSLPSTPTKEEKIKQAVEGQAIIWFEDRTMATVRLTDGPMPSKGLPAKKLPNILEPVATKKYPNTDLIASIRVKNFKPEHADAVRKIAEESGTVAWIKGEPRDISAWIKGRHTLDGETLED